MTHLECDGNTPQPQQHPNTRQAHREPIPLYTKSPANCERALQQRNMPPARGRGADPSRCAQQERPCAAYLVKMRSTDLEPNPLAPRHTRSFCRPAPAQQHVLLHSSAEKALPHGHRFPSPETKENGGPSTCSVFGATVAHGPASPGFCTRFH